MNYDQSEQDEPERPMDFRPMTEAEGEAYADAISDMERGRADNDDVIITFVADVTKAGEEQQELVASYPFKKEAVAPALMSLTMLVKLKRIPITLIAVSETALTGDEEHPFATITTASALPHYSSIIVGTANGIEYQGEAVEELKRERTEQVAAFWHMLASVCPEYADVFRAHGIGSGDDDEPEEEDGDLLNNGQDDRLSSFEGFDHLSDLLDYLVENDLFTEGDED